MQVVVQGVALAQELRREEEAALRVAPAELLGVAHGHGGLDHHDGLGVHLEHQPHHLLHVAGVEEVALRVVVGGRGDDDQLAGGVGRGAVRGGGEIQGALAGLGPRQEALDLLVADGALPALEHGDLLGHHVHRDDLVVLGEQARERQAHVPGARNGYSH